MIRSLHKRLRPLTRTVIILFVLWHMTAVGIASIPTDAKDPIAPTLRTYGYPIVKPYLLLTSQWQLWNLFSPDPLRRVSVHIIDRKEGENWIRVSSFDPMNIPFYRRTDTFKLLSHVTENQPLMERFLALQCEENDLPSGTIVRFVHRYYVLPYDDAESIEGHWARWSPEWEEQELKQFTCP